MRESHISFIYEFAKNYKLDLSYSRTPTCKDDMQSDAIKKGISRAPARAMLKATGLTDADLARPLVAIANTWTEVTPCNFHLRQLAERVKAGVRAAGGTPIEFDTITISDGITMGTEGMKASLVSREVIADSIELFVRAHAFDAVVAICGCDKTIPGTVMALARLNLPSLSLYGGSILAGHFAGREVTIMDVFEAVGACAAGKMTEKQLGELEDVACPGAGACGGQFTANTMAMALTFLGISPMGANEIPATDPRKGKAAFDCGKLVMQLLKDDIRPKQIITRESLHNAIASVASSGGSTNAVLHLLAIASDAGVPLTLKDFDEISAKTPVLADLKPGGRFNAPDMFRAGGMRVLGQRLREAGLLKDGITASGRKLFEEISDASETAGQEVVRPLAKPIKADGGLAILHGSIAPEGCVVKLAGHERVLHSGPARVFDSEEAAFAAVQSRQIQPGDVVVIRYEGPKGGPGMREMLAVTGALVGQGIDGQNRADHRWPVQWRDARADGRPRGAGSGERRADCAAPRRRHYYFGCKSAATGRRGQSGRAPRAVESARAALHDRRDGQVRKACDIGIAGRRNQRRVEIAITRRMTMAKMFWDTDTNPRALEGKRIAVLGYGSQGRAHALNLRDSKLNVTVGLRRGGPSWKQAEQDGWKLTGPAEAAEGADVIVMLAPDMAQPAFIRTKSRRPERRRDDLVFARLQYSLRANHAAQDGGHHHGRAQRPGKSGAANLRRRRWRALLARNSSGCVGPRV